MVTTMRWHLAGSMEIHCVIEYNDYAEEGDVDQVTWQLKPTGIGLRHLIDMGTALALIKLAGDPHTLPYQIDVNHVPEHLEEQEPGACCPECGQGTLQLDVNGGFVECDDCGASYPPIDFDRRSTKEE